MTDIDGRLLNSLRCLLLRPGALTVSFFEGRRKPYIGPIALFLVANVLFFATESLTGGLVFSTTLDSHLHSQPWSGLAQPLVARRLAALDLSLEVYAPRFDGAVALHARSLVLGMAAVFTLLVAVVFRRSRRPFAVHAAFSLHLYAFLLLIMCAGVALPAGGLPFGYARSTSPAVDAVLSVSLLIACGAYLFVAIGTVYRSQGYTRLVTAIGLTAGAAAIVLAYRFGLMLLTLYTA
ncbi:MAG TPA: DUF3667 domain-containing protein [Vicinamibacterales bacterium]|nr:DUF3667 domain-containing protein [Vicinamibacterales bacterium]